LQHCLGFKKKGTKYGLGALRSKEVINGENTGAFYRFIKSAAKLVIFIL
jgi:hypothetical protein